MRHLRCTWSALLLGAVVGFGPGAAADEASREAGREWTIRPEGLGRIELTPGLHVSQVRELYSEAKVEIREGRFNARVPTGYYFVFMDGARELFGIPCPCTPDENGKPRFEVKEMNGEEHVPVKVFTEDPRFRTDRGIGVGSTVGELRKAYPDFPKLVYHRDFYPGIDKGPPSVEYVCLLGRDANGERWGRLGTVERIRFYVRHPDGKKAAGRTWEAKGGQWVDPRAVIASVEPDASCNPNAH